MVDPHPSASRFRTSVARRVIGALAGLALAGGIAAGPALAASAATRPATVRPAAGIDAAEFAASLTPAQLAALGDGVPNVPATGLRFGDLDAGRRAAAFALLRSLLSPVAWSELADLIDADSGVGALDDYHLALFGDAAGDYVLQFSTGDLVLSVIRQGDEVDVRPDVAS